MLYCGAMTVVTWFVLVFTLCTGTSYLLWCIDRLPRTRLVLMMVAVPSFLAAIGLHGYFFSAS